jgi:hypothetical protein
MFYGGEDRRQLSTEFGTRPLAHLVPDPAEGVVGEELHDVPGSEELVAHGKLAAVPGSL